MLFLTGNQHKFAEAKSILKAYDVKISPLNLNIEEIRSESCARVAEASAQSAYERARKPLFLEDAGLFVKALNGFPGTYSSWAFSRLGNKGLLRLMRGVENRSAKFVSAIAYVDSKGVRTFTGACEGEIALSARGKKGFGYDPLFIPKGSRKTFAQDAELKKQLSHRRKALEKFAHWYSLKMKKG
ncbi:non-canonical purine NTP pyrophosphatase, RdgB/HAM1 family [Candidatus Micrarchaeota archaeon]|nr:MAG: non-canonical purine NTP pyrophosphatase, RdgB/HAM1 family [Candidatus Micrarchaeota archaeon]